jgi:uncharacterized membrane protein
VTDKQKDISYAVVASLIFGISPVFIRLILNSVNIETANILLSVFANILVVLLFIFSYSLALGKVNTTFPSTVLVYAVLGAVTGVVVSFILLYKALALYDVSKVATIMTAQPFMTAVCSFIILALVPSSNQILGGVLIVLVWLF